MKMAHGLNDNLKYMSVLADTDEKKEKEILKYEKMGDIKYSALKRTLSAKASFGEDTYDKLYLGVPEDKQSTSNYETEIEHFDFILHDAEEDKLTNIVQYGLFGYTERDPEDRFDRRPFAEFYAPTHVLDEIERLSARPDIEFHVMVNKKGWALDWANWRHPSLYR